MPGLSFRRVVCTGRPLPKASRWYECPAVIALNMLVGFKISANAWDHMRSANTPRNEGAEAPGAGLIHRAGKFPPPYLDTRGSRQKTRSAKQFRNSAIDYVRADGKHFRIRMSPIVELNTEQQLRALMDPLLLSFMLTLYVGREQCRNVLLIGTRITHGRPKGKVDRVRLYHAEEVAIGFVYTDGHWCWGNADTQTFEMMTGENAKMPPLRYLDNAVLYIPVEVDWRVAAQRFTEWSMMF